MHLSEKPTKCPAAGSEDIKDRIRLWLRKVMSHVPSVIV